MSVNTLSAGDALPSGDINAANIVGTEALLLSINETYILSCFLAPILKPCNLYGGLVASDVYPYKYNLVSGAPMLNHMILPSVADPDVCEGPVPVDDVVPPATV